MLPVRLGRSCRDLRASAMYILDMHDRSCGLGDVLDVLRYQMIWTVIHEKTLAHEGVNELFSSAYKVIIVEFLGAIPFDGYFCHGNHPNADSIIQHGRLHQPLPLPAESVALGPMHFVHGIEGRIRHGQVEGDQRFYTTMALRTRVTAVSDRSDSFTSIGRVRSRSRFFNAALMRSSGRLRRSAQFQ